MEHIIKMIPNPVNWFMTHEFNNLKKLNWTVERKCINLSWHHDQEVIYKCITPKFVLQWMSRSSHQTCSIKKVLLEISQNAQENICARISFLIKLRERPTTLLKIDSGTGVFLWILWDSKNTFLHRTFLVATCECLIHKTSFEYNI